MKQHIIFILNLFTLILFVISPGCYRIINDNINLNQITKESNFDVLEIQLNDGSRILFNEKGGKYFSHTVKNKSYCAIIGITPENKFVEINLNRIRSLNIRKAESSTGLKSIGIAVQVPLLYCLLMIFQDEGLGNCPSLYSMQNNQFIMEAQLLQGAFTSINKRSDYFICENLVPDSGTIDFMIRNDNPNEKQIIDEIKLFAYNHPSESEILTDGNNSFYEIKAAKNLYTNFNSGIIDSDSGVNSNTSKKIESKNALRDSILLNIPVDKETDSINLIIEGTSSFWNSETLLMVLKTEQKELEGWYTKPSAHITEIGKFVNIIKESELSGLKIKQPTKNGIKTISETKPFNSIKPERKLVTIYLDQNHEDTIKLLLTPPKMWWKINKIDLCPGLMPILPDELKMVSAFDHGNNSRMVSLSAIDNRQYAMPNFQDYAIIKFQKPVNSHNKYTYILKMTGYYEVSLPDKLLSKQIQKDSLYANPEYLIKFSAEQFNDYNRRVICDLP